MTGFIEFARAHGVEIDPAKLDCTDKIRRCGTTEKPRSTNGSYCFNGRTGWVRNWAGDAETHVFGDHDDKPWTEEEKAAWRAQRDRQRAQQEQSHERAARKAQELLRQAVPGTHDYLIRKGLRDAQGLVLPDGDLLVPMRSMSDNRAIQGVQRIHWNVEALKWEKKMLPGMRATGAVLRLGPLFARETVFCEGYATGLSIELAVRQMRLNAQVVVCFSAANMVHVAEHTTQGKRYVFADHDFPAKLTGQRAGHEAVRRMGLPHCMSPVEGEDANDVHVRAGLFSVAHLLMQARKGLTVP